MIHLKAFEGFYSDNTTEEICDILTRMLEGYSITADDLDIIQEHFEYEIPEKLKFIGTVYRAIFFDDHEKYKNCLRTGATNCKSYFSCTKDDACLTKIVNDMGTGYDYYVIFELDSTSENCIFDMNAMCKEMGVNSSYGYEEEVVIDAVVTPLPPDAIIDSGLVEDYE